MQNENQSCMLWESLNIICETLLLYITNSHLIWGSPLVPKLKYIRPVSATAAPSLEVARDLCLNDPGLMAAQFGTAMAEQMEMEDIL